MERAERCKLYRPQFCTAEERVMRLSTKVVKAKAESPNGAGLAKFLFGPEHKSQPRWPIRESCYTIRRMRLREKKG